MRPQPVRVLVVAESPMVRAGLEAIVAAEGDVTVVGGAAASAPATLARQLEDHEPDVVLLELGPHDEDVAATLPLLLAAPNGAQVAVVLVADEPTAALVATALRQGVRGVLGREAGAEEIVAATRAAAAGLTTMPAGLVDELLRGQDAPERAGTREQRPAAESELSPRELEVLRMLAEGLGNKQIAGRLGLSEHTVKFHVGSIFQKLHASTRTEAVTIGVRRGLLLL